MREVCRLIHQDGSVERIRWSSLTGRVYSDRQKGPLFDGFQYDRLADVLSDIGDSYRNRCTIKYSHEA